MSKTLLRVAGGFEIFFSLVGAGISLLLFLIFGISVLTALPVMLPLATAIVFLYIASLDDNGMREKKNWILTFSILAFCTGNLIIGILGIIAFNELRGPSLYTEKKVVDKRMRKMSLLLTLGVVLIVVAGVIFATSTWEILDGFVKTCVLIVGSLLFFGISSLAENKLKLTKSAVTYYLLGLFFAVTAYLAAGFFELFGTWFSFEGAGQELFISSLCFFLMLVALMTYWKYRKSGILYVVEFAATVGVVYLLSFVNVSGAWILLITLLFFGILVLVNQKAKLPTLTIFSNGAFIVAVIALLQYMTTVTDVKLDVIVTTLSVVWTATLLYVVALKRETMCFRILAPIVTVWLLTELLLFTGANGLAFLTKFAVMVLIVFAIGLAKREDKLLFNVTLGVTDLAFVYLVLDALRLDFGYFALTSAIALLVISFIVGFSGKLSEFHFERFVEPIKLILLTYVIYDLLSGTSFKENALFLGIIALLFAVMQLFKNGLMKNVYFVLALGFALITGISNLSSNAIVMPGFVAITFAILFLSAHRNMTLKYFESIIYAFFTLSLFMVVYRHTTDITTMLFYFSALILLYMVLGLILHKNQLLRTVSFTSALFPLYAFANGVELSEEVMACVAALIVLLVIMSYTRGVLKGASWEFINFVELFVIGLWFVALIFNADLLQGVVIGAVAILFVLVGYKSEEMWSYYYLGIGATILNLWIQLEGVWSKIPFWTYLLLAGLVLVGFVTYQEYSGHKKMEEEKEVNLEKTEMRALALSSEQVISGTIIYLIFFFSVVGIGF